MSRLHREGWIGKAVLFEILSPTALVSPYAGTYYAESKNVAPVPYVNTEPVKVERFVGFAKQVAELVPLHTEEPLLLAMSAILLALPEESF